MNGRIRRYGKRVGYTDAEMETFAFMRTVRCPDAGVDCMGYGEEERKKEISK